MTLAQLLDGVGNDFSQDPVEVVQHDRRDSRKRHHGSLPWKRRSVGRDAGGESSSPAGKDGDSIRRARRRLQVGCVGCRFSCWFKLYRLRRGCLRPRRSLARRSRALLLDADAAAEAAPGVARLMAVVCEDGFCDEDMRDKNWLAMNELLMSGAEPFETFDAFFENQLMKTIALGRADIVVVDQNLGG